MSNDPWPPAIRAITAAAPELAEHLRLVTLMLRAFAGGDFGTLSERQAVTASETLLARIDKESRRG